MNLEAAIEDLVDVVDTQKNSVYLSWDYTRSWQAGVLDHLLTTGFISAATKADTLQCHACHQQCISDVVFSKDGRGKTRRAFIVCEQPDMQAQMSRIAIPSERLQRWQSSPLHFAKAIAKLLGIQNSISDIDKAPVIDIGWLKFKKRRGKLRLQKGPLALELNQRSIPVKDLLYVDNNQLSIDREQLDSILRLPAQAPQKPYAPRGDRREARKAETQAKYQSWQDMYRELKKEHPHKPNVWIADRISKSPIAHGLSAETIRKHMLG